MKANATDKMQLIARLVLPLPSPNLSPNARVHWSRKAASTSKARGDARIVARKAVIDSGIDQPIANPVSRATFYFRTKARRDVDNAVASLKAYCDGLSDAGLIGDDSTLAHLPAVLLVDKSDPRVELEVFDSSPVPAKEGDPCPLPCDPAAPATNPVPAK